MSFSLSKLVLVAGQAAFALLPQSIALFWGCLQHSTLLPMAQQTMSK